MVGRGKRISVWYFFCYSVVKSKFKKMKKRKHKSYKVMNDNSTYIKQYHNSECLRFTILTALFQMQNPSNLKIKTFNKLLFRDIHLETPTQPAHRSRVSSSPDCVNIALKLPEVQTRSFRTQVTGHLVRRGLHSKCPVQHRVDCRSC